MGQDVVWVELWEVPTLACCAALALPAPQPWSCPIPCLPAHTCMPHASLLHTNPCYPPATLLHWAPRRPRIPTVNRRGGGRHWGALEQAVKEDPEAAAAKLFSKVCVGVYVGGWVLAGRVWVHGEPWSRQSGRTRRPLLLRSSLRSVWFVQNSCVHLYGFSKACAWAGSGIHNVGWCSSCQPWGPTTFPSLPVRPLPTYNTYNCALPCNVLRRWP